MAFLKHLNKIQFKRLFGRKAFFVFLSLAFFSFTPSGRELYIEMESLSLDNGKYIKVNSEILYDFSSEKMVSHFNYPNEYYLLNNSYGESKLYLPSKNGVIVRYGKEYSTQSSLLIQFLKGEQSDFGLGSQGFQIQDSYFEGQFFISNWIPPTSLMKLFSKVKLVTENDFPIYIEYINSKNLVVQKLYFSNYQEVNYSKIPLRITQVYYSSENDSTINRISFKNLRLGENLANKLRDYKIPDDAKLLD